MPATLTASGLTLSPRQIEDLCARHPFEPGLGCGFCQISGLTGVA